MDDERAIVLEFYLEERDSELPIDEKEGHPWTHSAVTKKNEQSCYDPLQATETGVC